MNKALLVLPFTLMAVIAILGGLVDVMDVDAAQYASISSEILQTGNWLEITNDHTPYLDKPPLLFWLSAASMFVFGETNLGYKLPSILFAALAVFSTYRLALLYHGREIGRAAALIIGSTVALALMTNDVRTDTLLVGSTITAVWLWAEFFRTERWALLFGAATFTALAMLAKGPIGAVLPAMALVPHLLLKHQISDLLRPKWILALPIIALLLLPMCVGLYRQFGREGVEFYFWTQSFGRITGANRWHDDSTFFYFSHVLLWCFAPWTLIGIAAIWRAVKGLFIKIDRQQNPEFFTVSAFVLGYCALSLSNYKLPHYIYIVLPFWVILTAKELVAHPKPWHIWAVGIPVLFMVLFSLILGFWAFPTSLPVWPLVTITLVCLCVLRLKQSGRSAAIWGAATVALAALITLNGHVYPQLLGFQANSVVGKWVKAQRLPEGRFISFATGGHALSFYAGHSVLWCGSFAAVAPKLQPGNYIYADADRYAELLRLGKQPKEVMEFTNYRVQFITLKFLNPATRNEAVKTNYVLLY